MGLLLLLALLVGERGQSIQRSAQVRRMVAFSQDVGALVGDLQVERGTSAIFMGSKGGRFQAELKDARQRTDRDRARFVSALTGMAADLAAAGAAAPLTRSRDALAMLTDLRGEVDGLRAPGPEVFSRYTTLIGGLLDGDDVLAGLTDDPAIALHSTSYIDLLRGKEMAGQERGVGGSGLSAGAFPPPLLVRFIQASGAQGSLLSAAATHATAAERVLLDQALKGPAAQEVEDLRAQILRTALAGSATGPVPAPTVMPISAGDWFAAATHRIAGLQAVDDRMAADIQAEAAASSQRMWRDLYVLLAGIVALLGISTVMAWLVGRGIYHPLGALTVDMERLADGDTSIVVEGLERGDEIGAMSRAVAVFKRNRELADRLAEEARANEAAKERRREMVERSATRFREGIGGVLESVAAAAAEMRTSAEMMSANAEETNRQSTAVFDAARQAAENVDTVAAAAEELAASIQEITRQVAQSGRIADNAVDLSHHTDQVVRGLNEATQRIGEIVGMINGIAGQTNLLALNATIEAARAGDAGKGFTVVAGEVKSLSTQTGRATEDITDHIGAVRQRTSETVDAISSITQAISQLHGIASSIAAAIEQQRAATSEIARNVQHAASGAQEVTSNIEGVSKAARSTGAVAGTVLASAQRLAEESDTLRCEVERFLSDIRDA